MMKMGKYTFIALFAALSALFGACGNDEPRPVNENAFDKCVFELTLSEYGSDQNEVVLTTVEYVTQDGRKLIDTFGKNNGPVRTIKSEDFTRAGFQGVITISENLLNGVQYDKDSYDLGLKIDFTVSSYGKNGRIINSVTQSYTDGAVVKTANLQRRYPPRVSTLLFSVDRYGQVSVSKKN